MKYFRRFLLILFFVAVFLAATNQRQIRDWWILRNYQPSAEIVSLADDTSMSEEGRHLFYVSQPELNDKTQFNDNCRFPERSIVLGCYSAERIYIFSVDNKKLKGVEEVTAAHEMLHAAYERLSADERSEIDELLLSTFDDLNDKRLNQTIDDYEEADPESVTNELHSILGTEHRKLPDKLEEHYSRYFNNRRTVVNISEDYEQVFEELQDQIAAYDKQLKELKNDIAALEAALESMSSFLISETARLEALLENDKTSAYNAAVPNFNATVKEYNSTIDTYQDKVDKHNRIVEKRNAIALEQNKLVQSLDSKFQPINN